jgi:Fic family protein
MSQSVQYHYGKFPPDQIDWAKLIPWIGPASAALARYDGTLKVIPNSSVLLSPLTTQEAVLSSKMEGTQATMAEVLEYEAGGDKTEISAERKNDIHEVLNYRQAVREAEKLLETLPLCQRIIKQAHSILMTGVRGHNKSPGEYRKIPNWIGPHGCSIEQATYVPVSADKLQDGLSHWEAFVHTEFPDKLVQLSILHAEFEALHPFLDGNGRLGRMFVPLFLFNCGLIHSPMFYISAFLEANKEEYCERLNAVSRDDNWTDWCVFFLKTIKIQAEENQKKAQSIMELYEEKKKQVVELTHSQYAIHSLDFIFGNPIFKSSLFVGQPAIPDPTAKRILAALRDSGMLKTLREGKGRMSAIYAFSELLNIAEGKNVF